jgi:hypothetical protein
MLAANRERGPGDALEMAAARSRADEARELRDAQASAPDPDGRAAELIARGVMPGAVSDLHQRLADKSVELAAERAKIEKGERVNARVRGMMERGQVGGLAAAQMMDGDFGDEARAEQLERQCDRLRQQIADTASMIVPPQERQLDGVEAASRHAHQVFAEVTRQRMADAQAGRSPGPRPFASRGGVAVRSEQCVHCTAAGVSDEQSNMLHNGPEFNVPVTPPGALTRAAGYSDTGVHGNHNLAVR